MDRTEIPARQAGRAVDALRDVEVVPDFVAGVPGSVLFGTGRTKILCAASIEPGTPSWLRDGEGWLTAEYALLPYATIPRGARARSGRIDGRSQEIQRLVGRALRGSIDRRRIPGYTIHIDCDVLQADGGTRTAAVSGASIALGFAVRRAIEDGRFQEDPRVGIVVAVSAGLVEGSVLLDLDYDEDSRADIDLNVVGTSDGKLVEVQGTSESTPIAVDRWTALLDLATHGLTTLGERLAPWMVELD